jgi:hypothetical protein
LNEEVTPLVDTEYIGEWKPVPAIEDAITQARTSERTEWERDCRINLAWFLGEPWYRKNARGEVEWIRPEHRAARFHVNIIFPRVLTLAGNETYVPKYEGRAGASPDLEDNMRVRGAVDCANHGVRVSSFPRAMREAHIYKHVFGLAWYKVGFDPRRGPLGPTWGQVPCPTCTGLGAVVGEVDGQAAPCPTCAAQGVQLDQPDMPQPPPGYVSEVVGEDPQGEVAVDLVPPWEVYFDPDAPSPFECQWLIHERDMDRNVAWDQFCHGTDIHAEDLQASSWLGDAEKLFSFSMFPGRKGTTSRKNQVRVREYYQLRTEKHRNGLYACVIGNRVIRAGALPFAHARIPYVPMRCHVVPGRMYPRSTVDNLLPLAVAYNDHLTNLYARAQQSVQLRVIAPRGSGFELSDVQGVAEYDHRPSRPRPEFFNDTGAPPDAAQMIERLQAEADTVSFASDVLRGESVGSADSARFSAFREQRAVNPIRLMIEDNAESHQRVGRLLVDTLKLTYRDGRLLRILGTSGHAKFRAFKLEQVGSSEDVELMAVRDIGRTLASRREDIYAAQKAGVFDDPRLMRMAEFSSDEHLFDEREAHESAAMMENEKVRHGQPISSPSRYENHEIHLECHALFLNELRMTFGPGSPQDAALVAHMDETERLKAWEDANRQAQMQQAQMQMQQQAATLGMANAANPEKQPEAVEQVSNVAGSDILSGAPAGPPESQQSLQEVDASLQGLGANNVNPA